MSVSEAEVLTEEKLSAILAAVKRAKTDNEKFAALLIVTKLTKGDLLTDDNRRLLLRTIGIKFPIRLLSTACAQSAELGANSISYATIGASVLSLFCVDEDLVREEEIEASIPLLIKTIKIFSKNQQNSGQEILKDCFTALEGLMQNEKCTVKLTKSAMFEVLCAVDPHLRDEAGKIIVILLSKSQESWNNPSVIKWVQSLAENFKNEQGIEKFTLCNKIFNIFSLVSEARNAVIKPYIADIIHGLEQILCSKITSEQRRPALLLASEVLRLVGISRFIMVSRKENFVVIVARIACIEIGLFFRDVREKDMSRFEDKNQLGQLVACFAIAECFCSAIAQFEQNETGNQDALNFEEIRLTQPALADMASCVVEYVTEQLSKKANLSPNGTFVLKSSIRMLGSWLNIENNVTSAQGIETLPLVPKMLSYVIERQDLELVKASLPVILVSAGSSETLKTLLNSGVLPVLHDALRSAIGEQDISTEIKGHIVILHLVLQTLLSIFASPNFTKISDYAKDLKQIFSTLLPLQEKISSIATMGYVYPLLAALLKNVPFLEVDCQSFLQRMLKFTFEAHNIPSSDGHLRVSERYKDIWSEISPLWQVCVQELTECIQKSQLIKNAFLRTKWPKILPAYLEAAKRAEDGEIIGLLFNLMEAIK